MARIYLSLGSNIEPQKNICSCMYQLKQDFQDVEFSEVYQTPAEGFSGDPFLNLVVALDSNMSLPAIQQYLKQLEKAHGRTSNEKKFSARTLDVDLLLYDQLDLRPAQNLPHKDILNYAFVLYPLAEIAPDCRYPGKAKTLYQLAEESRLDRSILMPVKLDCAPVSC